MLVCTVQLLSSWPERCVVYVTAIDIRITRCSHKHTLRASATISTLYCVRITKNITITWVVNRINGVLYIDAISTSNFNNRIKAFCRGRLEYIHIHLPKHSWFAHSAHAAHLVQFINEEPHKKDYVKVFVKCFYYAKSELILRVQFASGSVYGERILALHFAEMNSTTPHLLSPFPSSFYLF